MNVAFRVVPVASALAFVLSAPACRDGATADGGGTSADTSDAVLDTSGEVAETTDVSDVASETIVEVSAEVGPEWRRGPRPMDLPYHFIPTGLTMGRRRGPRDPVVNWRVLTPGPDPRCRRARQPRPIGRSLRTPSAARWRTSTVTSVLAAA